MEFEMEVIAEGVNCKAITPTTLISIADCIKCEFHGGITTKLKKVNNLPEVNMVACKVPHEELVVTIKKRKG